MLVMLDSHVLTCSGGSKVFNTLTVRPSLVHAFMRINVKVNRDIYEDNGEFDNLLGLITIIPTLTIIFFQMIMLNHKIQ